MSKDVESMTEPALVDEMRGYLRGKDRQGWRWVIYEGKTLRSVAFHADGTVDGDYDRLTILRGMVKAHRGRAERRSEAAKKAAVTRKRRQDANLQRLAKAIVEQHYQGTFRYSSKCTICGKKMNDEDSRQRGVGPDCWASAQNLAQKMLEKKEATQ